MYERSLKGTAKGVSQVFMILSLTACIIFSFMKAHWHENPELNIGAYYHVINRGNYRNWIFESSGARNSFLNCLQQTCHSMQWRLHAWCLMGNHYHLCIETPDPT